MTTTTEKLAQSLREILGEPDRTLEQRRDRWARAREALAAHEAAQAQAVEDERGAFEHFVSEGGKFPGCSDRCVDGEYRNPFSQTSRRAWCAALSWVAGRASAQAVPAGFVLVSKSSIEALNEWAGDSQFYPNQPESKLVNPLMHRVMQETDAWLAAAPKGDWPMTAKHRLLLAAALVAMAAQPHYAMPSLDVRERQGRDRDWQDPSEDLRRLRLAAEKRARKAAKRAKGL